MAAEETREAIRRAFMRLYARRPLDRITVKELCAAAPVARTTFYSHYGNVDDVLREVEDDLLAGLEDVARQHAAGDLRGMDFAPFLSDTLSFIKSRWTDFRALLVTRPDQRFVARWQDAVKGNFALRYPRLRALRSWDVVAQMAASAVTGAYAWWMEHPDASGEAEFARMVERALDAVVASIG